MIKDLWSLLRGDAGVFEVMYDQRAKAYDKRYEDREHYHELAHLHRRMTFLSRLILILTIAMIASAFGSALSGIAYLIARFAQ